MQKPTERQVLDWLRELGKLLPAISGMTSQAMAERLMAMLPMLLEDYDSRDFNADSRKFVARNCKFFPSYSELCDLLDKWPKPAEKPSGAASEPQDANLNDEDRMCIDWWNRRVREGATKAQLDSLASIIRARSFKAWERIQPPEEDDKFTASSVQRSVASLRGHPLRVLMTGVLISALIAKAPDLLSLLEDDALDEDGIGLDALRKLYDTRAADERAGPIFRETAAYRLSRLPRLTASPPPQQPRYEPPPKPLRDVTLKGDRLRESRRARGLNVPDQAA